MNRSPVQRLVTRSAWCAAKAAKHQGGQGVPLEHARGGGGARGHVAGEGDRATIQERKDQYGVWE